MLCSLTWDFMWWIEINESVPLNSTKLITLDYIGAEGLGQLNLNYVEPAGSHQKASGKLFHINHDSTQPNAVTYNQNAIHTTSTPAAATPTSSPSSPSLPASTENILISSTVAPQLGTSSPAPNNITSPNIQGRDIAIIALGVILGITVATGLVLYRLLRRRIQRASLEASRNALLPALSPPPTNQLCETDAATPPNELPSKHDQPELPGSRR